MAWIESHQQLRSHPKLRKFRSQLKVSRATAIGHLHMLWWWVIDYAMDGNISKYSPEEIADAADWEGDAEQFVKALDHANFTDIEGRNRVIHDWHDFCGTLVEKRLDRSEASRNAAKLRWEKRAKHSDKSTLGTERTPMASERMPTQPNPTVPNRTVPNPQKNQPKGLNRPSTPFRHKGVIGNELKRIDGGKNGYKPPDNPVRKFLLVLKQLQGYDVKDAAWDETYLDQYNDDAVKFLKFFKMDWREAGTCAVEIVKEFKEKELSWSLRTIINRAPFWRKDNEKATAKV